MRIFGLALCVATITSAMGAHAQATSQKCRGNLDAVSFNKMKWGATPDAKIDQTNYGVLAYSAISPRRLDIDFQITNLNNKKQCTAEMEPFFIYSHGGKIRYDYSAPPQLTGQLADDGFQFESSINSGDEYYFGLPEGDYEITAAAGNGAWNLIYRNVSIKFSVERDRVTYIGEYNFIPLKMKYKIGKGQWGGWKIVVSDQSMRELVDLDKLNLAGMAKIISIPPANGRPNPLFDSKP